MYRLTVEAVGRIVLDLDVIEPEDEVAKMLPNVAGTVSPSLQMQSVETLILSAIRSASGNLPPRSMAEIRIRLTRGPKS